MLRTFLALLLVASTTIGFAQPQQPSPKDFVKVASGVIALEHVRLIDGTGAAAKVDQTILISGDNWPYFYGKPEIVRSAGRVLLDIAATESGSAPAPDPTEGP